MLSNSNMTIDSKFIQLRKNIKQKSRFIINHIIKTHVIGKNTQKKDICIFCSSSESLTKEHIIPKWTFEDNTEGYFITDINEIKQTYNKSTVPTCANCNNNLLSCTERYIIDLFKDLDSSKILFSDYEIQNIIRWLEIIEYKFQILEIRRKFIKLKNGTFIPYLADFPISIIRWINDLTPSKIVSQIRFSQKRITIKSKKQNINSLIVFKTNNKWFHFFHNMNEFIFLELPKHNIALFYFYNKLFNNNSDAYNEAMKIINKFY